MLPESPRALRPARVIIFVLLEVGHRGRRLDPFQLEGALTVRFQVVGGLASSCWSQRMALMTAHDL